MESQRLRLHGVNAEVEQNNHVEPEWSCDESLWKPVALRGGQEDLRDPWKGVARHITARGHR